MAAAEGHGLRRLVIALVVLALVLVAADRIAVVVAEHAAESSIQQSQRLTSRPAVDVHGFPFLTQLAASSYDEITVTAHDVPVGQGRQQLMIANIRLDLHDVDTARNFSRIHARTATATARVSLSALSRVLGVTLSYAGGGRVRASKSFTVAGRTFTPSITAAPAIRNGTLAFISAAVDGAGAEVASVLKKIFGVTIPLDSIPFDITVRDLTIDKDGLVLALAGTNITYDERA